MLGALDFKGLEILGAHLLFLEHSLVKTHTHTNRKTEDLFVQASVYIIRFF